MKERISLLFKIALYLYLPFFLYHISFLLLHPPSPSFFSFSTFLDTLRFDMTTLGYLLFLPGIFLLLPKKFLTPIYLFIGAPIPILFSFLIADLIYFSLSGKHISWEISLFIGNFKELFPMLIKGYLLFSLLAIVLGIGTLFLLLRSLQKSFQRLSPYSKKQAFLLLIGFLGIEIFAIRGGLSYKPIHPVDAFYNKDLYCGHFALNPVYLVFYSLFHQENLPPGENPSKKRINKLKKFLLSPQEEFIEPLKYPFLRRKKQPSFTPYNILWITLESTSYLDTSLANHPLNPTPFLKELSSWGSTFTHAYSTAPRTIQSIPSMLSSIPSLYGKSPLLTSLGSNRYFSLARVLSQKGYKTYFFYLARKGSMYFDSLAYRLGFTHFFSQEDFPFYPTDGTWGIYDAYLFEEVYKLIKSSSSPFFIFLITLYPHPPFLLPKDFSPPYPPSIKRHKYFNSLFYIDGILKKFFLRLKKLPVFSHTLIIITSDHGFEKPPGKEIFHVPLILIGEPFPKKSYPYTVSTLDILPTLILTLGLKEPYAVAGKSLFYPFNWAIVDMDKAMALIQEERFLFPLSPSYFYLSLLSYALKKNALLPPK